jgi:hypothetical protein
MKTLRATFIAAALLSAASAYADVAPHWSAAIGTGRVSESTSKSTSQATPASASGIASAPHWSASIGTGRANDAPPVSSAKSPNAARPTASAHWTSRIGTGRAAESSARIESSPVAATRDRP